MLTARLYGIVAKPLVVGVGPHLRFNVRRLRGLFGGLFCGALLRGRSAPGVFAGLD